MTAGYATLTAAPPWVCSNCGSTHMGSKAVVDLPEGRPFYEAMATFFGTPGVPHHPSRTVYECDDCGYETTELPALEATP